MKLIGYEYLKWLHKRLLVALIPILLIGNGYLYITDQYNKNGFIIANKEAYDRAEREYAAMPVEQGYARIKQQYSELLLFQAITMAARNPDNEAMAAELARIKSESPSIMDLFYSRGYNERLDQLQRDTIITEQLVKQFEAMRDYTVYLDGIKQQADNLLSVSIFQNEHSFSYRNIVKTPKDFAELKELPLQLGREWGIVSATTFSITDLLIVVLLFLLCIYLFQQDKDLGLIKLARSTARGRLPLAVSKLIALLTMSVFLSVIYYGELLLLAQHLYGFGDLSRYVQSMESFRYCNLPLTVGQYLALFIACKVIVNLVVAIIIAMLFIGLGNILSVYVSLFGFFAFEYLTYRFIHPLSNFQFFKYINVLAFYNAYDLLAVYRNLNVAGYPIWYPGIAAFVFVAIIVMLFTVCVMLFSLRMPSASTSHILHRLAQPFHKLRRPIASVQLFRHEWYKFIFTGKAFVVLLAALLLGYLDLDKKELNFNEEDAYYNSYLTDLTGTLETSNEQMILDEKQRFDELPLQYELILKQYRDGDLSAAQYIEEKEKLDLIALKEKAFNRVYNQYLYLKDIKDTRGITGSMLNELTTNYLFRNSFRDLVNGCIFTILLAGALSAIFPLDYRNGMINIIRGTQRGRMTLFVIKHMIAFAATVTIGIILYAPSIYNLIINYPAIDWNAPVQSINVYGQLKAVMTIKAFVCGVFALQLFGSLIVCICMLYVTNIMKNRAPALLLISSIFIIPFLVSLAGFEEINNYTFSGFFTLFDRLADAQSFASLGIYSGLMLCVSALALFMSWLRYTNLNSKGVISCFYRLIRSAKVTIKGSTRRWTDSHRS
ncbi:hypothetical protein PCURB6_26110 [Paenibacillus curdlanolyticus]|nr:hypothetical protein [Paenibacillus curdlanolyticus]GFN32351.1 hypothetical protein PCURB6_26110 [Paenibacillus curdlanolyticus]